MSERFPQKPDDLDENIAADWEGADDLEQDLQDKIKSNMEKQEPKIEVSSESELKEKALVRLGAIIADAELILEQDKELDERTDRLVRDMLTQANLAKEELEQ